MSESVGDDKGNKKEVRRMPKKAESIGVREFARQIGKSHTWVYKLLKEGRLPRNEDGTIPVKAGFTVYNKILQGTSTKAGETLPDSDDAPMSAPLVKAVNVTEAFNKARLAEKTYQAKLKEIEYKIKRGELVESSAVREDAAKTGSAVRGRLMSIPVRVSGLCEGRTAREIEEILEGAINDALTELQKSEFIEA